MLIGDNPYKIAFLIEPVKEWNDYEDNYGSWNGIMLFLINGFLFPDKETVNITLSYAIPELIDNMEKIPINKDIFLIANKKDAFISIYSIVYPDNCEIDGDWEYKVAPQEFFDRGLVVFAVSDGKHIRFLASKLSYDVTTSRHKLANITVRESVISIVDLELLLTQLDNCLQQIRNY